MRIALLIEYEGTRFSGWQIQPNGATIQGALEDAFKAITQKTIRVYGAGRTDAGVHAAGQVAHADLELPMPIERLAGALNTQLPDSIRILATQNVSSDFNSRFDAISREYEYTITTQPRALNRKMHWFCKVQLDHAALQETAGLILGEKDFRSFCASKTDTENMICQVTQSDWQMESNYLIYHISGNRFLHHMVRMLVGTMVEVARGRWKIEQFQRLLDEPTHEHHTVTAPARGLVLNRIHYPESLHLFKEYYGD